MILRKAVEDPADRAGLCEHAPDFSSNAIEIEVSAGAQTHDNDATVELGSGQCLVLHKNAIGRQVQSRNSAIVWAIRSSSTDNANCGSMAQSRRTFVDETRAIIL